MCNDRRVATRPLLLMTWLRDENTRPKLGQRPELRKKRQTRNGSCRMHMRLRGNVGGNTWPRKRNIGRPAKIRFSISAWTDFRHRKNKFQHRYSNRNNLRDLKSSLSTGSGIWKIATKKKRGGGVKILQRNIFYFFFLLLQEYIY